MGIRRGVLFMPARFFVGEDPANASGQEKTIFNMAVPWTNAPNGLARLKKNMNRGLFVSCIVWTLKGGDGTAGGREEIEPLPGFSMKAFRLKYEIFRGQWLL